MPATHSLAIRVLRSESDQMQTRADAESAVYSVENRKPGDQRYEAQNDRQENKSGVSRIKKTKTRNKQGQDRNQSCLTKGCHIQYHNKLAYK